MIDWHCHILPRMDDGSKDPDESLALLKMLVNQKVDVAIATPHFYANNESVAAFSERRQKSYETLISSLAEIPIQVLLGAEVRYYPGISKLAELNQLCVADSGILLLEMPSARWTEYTVKELVDLTYTRKIKLMLAHIERYLLWQNSDVWERLYDAGILMQVNATFFTKFATRRKAVSMLQNGGVHFIGSDCHSVQFRPPRIADAFEIIRKKCGDDLICPFNEFGYSMLGKKY